MLYILQCSIVFYRILQRVSSKIHALNIFILNCKIFRAFSYLFFLKGDILWTFMKNFPLENLSPR